MLPTDPMILLSYVNTQLRDFYPDLTSFCKDNGLDQEEICKKPLLPGKSIDLQRC